MRFVGLLFCCLPLMAQTDYVYLNCDHVVLRKVRALSINSQSYRELPQSPYDFQPSVDDLLLTWVRTVAVSDPGPFLYASRQGPDQLYGYRRLPDGNLETLPGFPKNLQPNPLIPEHCVVWVEKHPLLPVLYTSNACSANISIYGINPDGSLVEFPESPYLIEQFVISPQGLAFTPDGQTAFLNTFDSVGLLSMKVDAQGLLSSAQHAAHLGGQPGRGVVITPDGQYLYATNRVGNHFFGFRIVATELTPLPGFPMEIPLDTFWPAIQGRWLAAGGHDVRKVAVWEILADGNLRLAPGSPLNVFGAQMLYPAFNPTGNRIAFGGNTILNSFHLASDGRLTLIEQPPMADGSVCWGTSMAPEITGDPHTLDFLQLPEPGDDVLVFGGQPNTPFYLGIDGRCVGPLVTDQDGFLEYAYSVGLDQSFSIRAYCDEAGIETTHTVPTLSTLGLWLLIILLALSALAYRLRLKNWPNTGF